MSPHLTIRPAGPDDVPLLVQHHHKMFVEIAAIEKRYPEGIKLDEIDKPYCEKLGRELGRQCHAWIAEMERRTVASGAVSLLSMVPVPGDASCTVAYIHSIYTELPFRKNGIAAKIMDSIIEYCKSQKICRLILNASHAGQPIYKKLGFTKSDNHMRLWLGQ